MLSLEESTLQKHSICLSAGEVLCELHSKVSHVFQLKSGTLEYFTTDEVTLERTSLITVSKPGTIIGWEIFNDPERSIVSVSVLSDFAMLDVWTREDFLRIVNVELLKSVCSGTQFLLQSSFTNQINLLSNQVRKRVVQLENYYISQLSTLSERKLLLKSSPFFSEFCDEYITLLADVMIRREYEANDLIYDQGDDSGGIFILIQGEVSIRRTENLKYLDLRSISTPGYLFGWNSTFSERESCSATAHQKTSVYFISKTEIQQLLETGAFGYDFYKMVIWLQSNQLQMSFSRYLHLLDDHGLVSVKHLIDINRPRIPLPSPLLQIPHLLKDTTTHPLAFTALHQLNRGGTKQERHLASICLDILKTEEREMILMEKIAEVYKTVSGGKTTEPELNRRRCAEAVKQVFEVIDYRLEGMEYLPKDSGHIFIYNHLINHPHYTLSNNFQLTLDSHFIGAMILEEAYGNSGIRTVRIGESAEYGHQDYYDKLGYHKVYTQNTDLRDEQSRALAKAKFYQEANEHLANGENLIISPEGTSYMTEESPGPFKMGPFNLATQMEKEPLIIPILFSNFDKRIYEAIFFCRILPGFRISEKIRPGQTLKEFVQAYQQDFAQQVSQARTDSERLFHENNY